MMTTMIRNASCRHFLYETFEFWHFAIWLVFAPSFFKKRKGAKIEIRVAR
jgi:hypothetical protein